MADTIEELKAELQARKDSRKKRAAIKTLVTVASVAVFIILLVFSPLVGASLIILGLLGILVWGIYEAFLSWENHHDRWNNR